PAGAAVYVAGQRDQWVRGVRGDVERHLSAVVRLGCPVEENEAEAAGGAAGTAARLVAATAAFGGERGWDQEHGDCCPYGDCGLAAIHVRIPSVDAIRAFGYEPALFIALRARIFDTRMGEPLARIGMPNAHRTFAEPKAAVGWIFPPLRNPY